MTPHPNPNQVGATSTVIRAGTLKGGGSGDTANGSGDPSLLVGEVFYKLGQQAATPYPGPSPTLNPDPITLTQP